MGKLKRHMAARWSSGRDGAALVTAIMVVAILLAVGITATIMTRQEGRIARNVSDIVRAKMLADGGVNIAIAALNADLSSNRAITSIATIMRTYYGDDWKQVYDFILDGRERDIPDGMWLPAYGWDDRNGNGLNDWEDFNLNGVRDPGEPDELTILVGRYVFAIVDEASKININLAGNPGFVGSGADRTFRAHRSHEGVGPAEIDVAVVPWLDPTQKERFAFFRLGALAPPWPRPPDLSRAYGGAAVDSEPDDWRADDDADNLWVSSDGIDNDGDGLIDELDEGVNEPDEFRLFAPAGDDRPFKTIEQALFVLTYDYDADGLPDEGAEGLPATQALDVIRDLVTVDSADREVIYNPQGTDTRKQDLRLNLNLDDARTIAKTMIEKRPAYFGGGNRVRAFQIAANIADFRDKDFARTEIVDNRRVDNDGDGRLDEDGPGNGDEDGDGLIDEDPPEPGVDDDGDGSVDEDWVDGVDNDGDNAEISSDGLDNDGDDLFDEPYEGRDEDPPLADVYAGIEAIRINEIMVRPTRRIEAETNAQMSSNPLLIVPGFNVLSNADVALDDRGAMWNVRWIELAIAASGVPSPYVYLEEAGYGQDGVNGPFDGNVDDNERRTLVFGFAASELVPDGPYYVILDFSIPDPNDPVAPVRVSEAAVEYRVGVAGVYTPWVTKTSAELAVAPVPGRVAIDFDPADARITPLLSLAPSVVVEVRKDDEDQVGVPAYFNGVILSQEPDMEWVELVNVGTKPVRLDDWELEVAGGAIGTIPPNTVVQPGRFVLLTVDWDDSVPLGASADSIFGNGMSLFWDGPFAGWDSESVVVQLVFRNNAVEATEESPAVFDGMFPNNPRDDGNDNDGDNMILISDGADNDGDGTADNGDEGIDEEARTIWVLQEVPVAGEMQVVTLYEGPAQWGRVVDRVTYSSADVANANRNYLSLRNQPDLDFYRSLERINPYYAGDRPRHTKTNNLRGYGDGGYLDGSYDDWARSTGSTFATPLYPNVSAVSDSEARGDYELLLPRVKNANFSTVGEIVDVPFYNPTEPFRPTTITIPEAAAILELTTTSRMDLTIGQSVVEPDGVTDPDVGWVRGFAFETRGEGAEAVWRWDIDDGLEDGVYNLYAFIGEGLWDHPDTRPVTIEVFSDINDDDFLDTTPAGDDSFGAVQSATARPDGVLSYGTVQVRGNMLAVRIVNLAETGVANTFTRIALAPRRRDYGKININNVWPRTVRRRDNAGNVIATEIIDPLCALPGLLQEWKQDTLGRWRLFPSPDYSTDTGDPTILDRARRRANAIIWLREGLGGYRSVGGLLQELAAPAPTLWSDQLDTTLVIDTGLWTEHTRNLVLMKETLERFKHISNLVTERSDVFEIICIAQAGQYFGGEFVPVGEKKIRVVYER